MQHPITLAQARAEGRDPLHILGADRALLLDAGWLARAEAGAPLMFWGEDDEEDDAPTRTPYELVSGVAVLDVEGPIAQRGWFCIDGYDTIADSLTKALGDSRVASVLLRLNSPGGAAAGAFEWCGQMRDRVVASKKRCVAYADEMALSGAYALACVADEIVVPETGEVGSVGVIASVVSRVKKNDMEGREVAVIRAGAEKADGHPDLPLDPAALARIQADVDRLASTFHRWVGERRRMAVEAVAALEAGTRMGGDAVSARLADRVLGYHALLAEMQRTPTKTSTPGASVRATSARGAGATTPRKSTMNEQQLAALAAATGETDPDTMVAAVARMKARADAAEASLTKMTEERASAEKRAAEAEARAETMERNAEIEAAKADRKWTPALDGFLASLSVAQLKTWRASAPVAVPEGEIKPPPEAPATTKGASAKVAALIEKAEKEGWNALSGGEKAAITRHSQEIANSLRATSR